MRACVSQLFSKEKEKRCRPCLWFLLVDRPDCDLFHIFSEREIETNFCYFLILFCGKSVDLFSWFGLQSKFQSLAVAPTCRKAPSHSFVSVSPTLKLSSRFFRDKMRERASHLPSKSFFLVLPSGRIFTIRKTDYWAKKEKRDESRRRRVGGGCSPWRQSF